MLVVQGDADPYGTTAQLDAIEAGVAGSVERLLVPDTGHAPHGSEALVVERRRPAFVRGLDSEVAHLNRDAYDLSERR